VSALIVKFVRKQLFRIDRIDLYYSTCN